MTLSLKNRNVYRLWYVKQLLRDEYELRVVPSLCDPARITVDVGGNRGAYALTALPWSREVVVFEPQPQLLELLHAVLPDKAKIVESAVSASAGRGVLAVPTNSKHHGWARILDAEAKPFADDVGFTSSTVPTIRLDDAVTGDVGFIKIDVEGHEMAVLESAEAVIARSKPNFLIEIEERHSAVGVAATVGWLEARGYNSFFYDGDTLRPGAEFDVEVHQNLASLRDGDRCRSAAYINNFIFVPEMKTVAIAPSIMRSLRGLSFVR